MNIVKLLRLTNKYTQDEVSKHIGCTVSTYNRKENAISDFTAQEYVLLSELYNVSVDKLLDKKWFKETIDNAIHS